jgi:hypothetical protein
MAPRTSTELNDLIKNLRTIRRHHEQALAEIQSTLRQNGLEHLLASSRSGKRGAAAAPAAKAGRGKAKAAVATKGRGKAKVKVAKGKRGPKAAATGTRRKRAKYSQTAEEFILSFLSKHRSATTSEIRQHWQKQGRGGKAENSLTGLVKSGKLIRSPRPGQAGSSYSLPSSTPSA